MSDQPPVIACFGEILWDCLPRGLFPGGAPMNVAHHLAQLGVTPLLISAVGRDFLGKEITRRLADLGLSLAHVSRRRKPTGTVRAELDADGVATYTFAPNPAWDHITAPRRLRQKTQPPAAVVFGSLALRGSGNRREFEKLIEGWPGPLRVLDLNLWQPHDRPELIAWVLAKAQFLKLNDGELGLLADDRRTGPEAWAAAARKVAKEHGLSRICVTAGARGAGLLWDGEWMWEEARPVEARDTVGSGDAFLASFLAAILHRRETPRTALAQACRLGEFVATQDGATPTYQIGPDGLPSLS